MLLLRPLLACTSLGLLAACHPDQPTTGPAAARAPTASAPAAPAPPASPAAPTRPAPTDTLHLPSGQVAELRPATAAAFARLDSTNSVPASGFTDSLDQPLPAGVQRAGRTLRLHPAAGAGVAFRGNLGSRFQFLGSLPAAHQWVVAGTDAAGDYTTLVDQRTGSQLYLPGVQGRPASSPRGSFVLVPTVGASVGDVDRRSLTLVRITPAGPRQLWQHRLARITPVQARWAGPGRWLLQVVRPAPGGGATQYNYLEMSLPAATTR